MDRKTIFGQTRKISASFLTSKKIAASLFIFLAVVLIALAKAQNLRNFDWDLIARVLPKPADLATSPVAQKELEKIVQANTNDNPAMETQTEPAQNKDKNTVAIPSLGTELPLVVASTTDNAKLHDLLDFGVVLYPGSAAFARPGQTVMLGHSAPDNWPDIRFERAFSRIDELNPGDEIIVSYLDKEYHYSVVRTQIIAKGTNFIGAPQAGNTLVLLTCWPPGRNDKRIAVEASFDFSE